MKYKRDYGGVNTMRRKIISLILCLSVLSSLFIALPITVEAFDYSVYNSLCPITIYPCTSDSTFPAYSSVECTSKKGTIYKSDRCTITKFYKNSDGLDVCKVTYPISGGTKTAYAKTVRFIHDKSFSPQKMTATAKTNVSAYAGSATLSGWYVEANQKIYLLGRSGNNSQIAYPISGGYKIAWIKNYDLKYNANGGSSAPSAQKKEQNVNLTITNSKPSKTGYTFQNWNTEKDGSGTKYSAGGTYKKNSGDTLYAQWKINTYKLTVSSANATMGTVSGGGTYDYNKKVTIKATPNTGYSFVSWNDGNTSASRSVTVTKAATYTANFKANTYTLTVKSSDSKMGSVSGGGSANYGTFIVLTAKANSGYHFVKWDDNNTSATRNVTVSGNKTYTAVFAKNEYTIDVQSDNATMGSVSGGGKCLYLDTVTIVAKPNSGYKFTRWNDNNTSASRQVSVTGNATYTAYFEPDQSSCTHIYNGWITDDKPTCTSQGSKHRVCSKCGYVDYDSIPILPHQYDGNWVIDEQSTCDTNGSKHRVCTLCHEAIETIEIPASGHDYSNTVITVAPTCTDIGLQEVFCTQCGGKDESSSKEIPALGHSYPNEWIIEQEATCQAEGSRYRLCTVCNDKETDSIETLEHEFRETVYKPTDTEQGKIVRICEKCGYTETELFYDEIQAGTVTVGSQYANAGDIVTVPFSITDNPGLTAFTLTMKYDNSVITPVPINNSDAANKYLIKDNSILTSGALNTNLEDVNHNAEDMNEAIIHWENTTSIDSDGILFSIRFKVNDYASTGGTKIELSYKKENMIGSDGLNVIPLINNGTITVMNGSIANIIKGDVNLDSDVNSRDGILLSKYLAGWNQDGIGWTKNQKLREEAADIFTDGKINTKDGVSLAMKLSGYSVNTQEIALLSTDERQATKIEVGKSIGTVGGYVDVPVSLINNTGIAGFKFVLSYNKNYLTPVELFEGDIPGLEITNESNYGQPQLGMTSNMNESNIDKAKLDYITAQWCDNSNMTVNGVLFTVRFKVNTTSEIGQNIPVELNYELDNPVCGVTDDNIIYDVAIDVNQGSVMVVEDNKSEREMQYEISDVKLTSEDGIEISQIPAGTNFNAKIAFHRLNDELVPGEIILAAYDYRNRFIKIYSKSIDIKMLTNGQCEFNIISDDEYISGIKIFIWNELNGMIPLAEPYCVN